MSSTAVQCVPGSALHDLLDTAVRADSFTLTLRSAARGTSEAAAGAGQVSFQSGAVTYIPYPATPEQVMSEIVLTPPTGLDEAGRMLHALRAEVHPEMRVDVDAHLSDGYSRWSVLYTHSGLLVAHCRDY